MRNILYNINYNIIYNYIVSGNFILNILDNYKYLLLNSELP